ncbi:MAG: tetratricopeptide repeat protein, partial [Anaerolineaceae bacterium]
LALRRVFLAALESLRPEEGSPNYFDKRWRPYIILTEQYLNERNPDWVKEQLHVSKGTYFGEQGQALERLAEVLYKWELESSNADDGEPVRLTTAAFESRRAPLIAPSRASIPLIGRDDLLCRLKKELVQDGKQAVLTLDGLPGVGKTAVAVELAHDQEVQNYFHDGILWANLGRQPDLLSLLGNWAAAVGVTNEVIASRTTLAEREAIIHAAIGMRRMLLIIDDAWQTEEALAFKIGGPNCAYLLTTRLAEVALDFTNGQTTTVRELNQEDAARLLTQIAPWAIKTAPHEIQKLIPSLGGLPLALILIGRYLEKQSYRTQLRRLQEALSDLEEPRVRLKISQPAAPLDNLHPNPRLGTPLSLQTMICLSTEILDAEAYQALLDLSIFPAKPNTFSEDAALAVIGAPASVLDRLVDSGLVECVGIDRYTLHQTISDYASIQGAAPAAVTRLVEYMIWYVEEQGDRFQNLDRELNNILTAVDFTVKSQDFNRLNHWLNLLFPYLETRGLYPTVEKYLKTASDLAQTRNDQAGQAEALYRLADLQIKRGQFKTAQGYLIRCIEFAQAARMRELEARSLFQMGLACHYAGDFLNGRNYLEKSLQMDQELGLDVDEGFALLSLGYANEELGNYDLAISFLEQAMGVCTASGNRRGEGWTHYNLSMVYLPMGDFSRAMMHSEACSKIYHELGDRRGEGWLIYHQGRIYRQQEKVDCARDCFERSCQILNEIGDWMGVGFAVHNLGLIASDLGDDASAQGYIEQALEIFQRIDCVGYSQAIHSLGVLRRRHGDYSGAIPFFERSLQHRREIGYRRGEAIVLANLGLTSHFLGDDQTAMETTRQALKIIEPMGARPNLACVLTFLGQIQFELGLFDDAADSYQRAWTLREQLGQPGLALEPLAGLAWASLQQGRLAYAASLVEKILKTLEEKSKSAPLKVVLAGIDSPLRVYLACVNVLSENGDPRTKQVLETAGQLLRERANQIPDEAQRRLFLERVSENREISARLKD